MVTMTAKQWYDLGIKEMPKLNLVSVISGLRQANNGAKEDVFNINGNGYYQWSMAIAQKQQPVQAV